MATTGAFNSGNVNIGATAGSVFRPNVWSKEVLMFVKSNLVLLPLIKHYDAEVKSSGQTLEIPNVSGITANLKAQNTVVTLNYNTETKTTITLNKHYESSFVIEDLVKVQSAYDLRSDYTQAAGYAISEKIDSNLATDMTAAWKTAGQAYGAYGTALNDNLILTVNRYLGDNKAPRTDRVIVTNPKGESEFLAIDKYVRYDALGVAADSNSIKTGKIGQIYGYEVFVSQNLVYLDTATDEYNTLMFHKEAWAIALQMEPRTQAQYKQEHLGWLVTVDVLYGQGALRSNFGFVLKH